MEDTFGTTTETIASLDMDIKMAQLTSPQLSQNDVAGFHKESAAVDAVETVSGSSSITNILSEVPQSQEYEPEDVKGAPIGMVHFTNLTETAPKTKSLKHIESTIQTIKNTMADQYSLIHTLQERIDKKCDVKEAGQVQQHEEKEIMDDAQRQAIVQRLTELESQLQIFRDGISAVRSEIAGIQVWRQGGGFVKMLQQMGESKLEELFASKTSKLDLLHDQVQSTLGSLGQHEHTVKQKLVDEVDIVVKHTTAKLVRNCNKHLKRVESEVSNSMARHREYVENSLSSHVEKLLAAGRSQFEEHKCAMESVVREAVGEIEIRAEEWKTQHAEITREIVEAEVFIKETELRRDMDEIHSSILQQLVAHQNGVKDMKGILRNEINMKICDIQDSQTVLLEQSSGRLEEALLGKMEERLQEACDQIKHEVRRELDEQQRKFSDQQQHQNNNDVDREKVIAEMQFELEQKTLEGFISLRSEMEQDLRDCIAQIVDETSEKTQEQQMHHMDQKLQQIETTIVQNLGSKMKEHLEAMENERSAFQEKLVHDKNQNENSILSEEIQDLVVQKAVDEVSQRTQRQYEILQKEYNKLIVELNTVKQQWSLVNEENDSREQLTVRQFVESEIERTTDQMTQSLSELSTNVQGQLDTFKDQSLSRIDTAMTDLKRHDSLIKCMRDSMDKSESKLDELRAGKIAIEMELTKTHNQQLEKVTERISAEKDSAIASLALEVEDRLSILADDMLLDMKDRFSSSIQALVADNAKEMQSSFEERMSKAMESNIKSFELSLSSQCEAKETDIEQRLLKNLKDQASTEAASLIEDRLKVLHVQTERRLTEMEKDGVSHVEGLESRTLKLERRLQQMEGDYVKRASQDSDEKTREVQQMKHDMRQMVKKEVHRVRTEMQSRLQTLEQELNADDTGPLEKNLVFKQHMDEVAEHIQTLLKKRDLRKQTYESLADTIRIKALEIGAVSDEAIDSIVATMVSSLKDTGDDVNVEELKELVEIECRMMRDQMSKRTKSLELDPQSGEGNENSSRYSRILARTQRLLSLLLLMAIVILVYLIFLGPNSDDARRALWMSINVDP